MTAPTPGMYDLVPAAPAAAPPSGLLLSARRPEGEGNDWVTGLSWVPEQCGMTVGNWSPCADHVKPVGVPPGIEYYLPTGYSVGRTCTTLSTRNLDGEEAIVRRQMEALASFEIAEELWTGTETSANPPVNSDGTPNPNQFLSDGSAVDLGTHLDVISAFAELEQGTMQASHGQQVFLHVAPAWVTHLANRLERVGNLLMTRLGNIVVADAGYPGTGDMSGGTSEVQTVTITGAPTGGNFTLTFDGQTTIAIGYDSPAEDVQGALNSLSNLDGVVVTGAAGGPYTVTFPADMGDVPEMTGDGSGLTGGTAPAVDVTTTTPGVAPAPADTFTAYGTGPVVVRMTTVEVTVDRNVRDGSGYANRYQIIGKRIFAATFDPCIHTQVTADALAG